MGVRVENLNLKVGAFSLNNISFDLPTGKIAVILGPSGSGKSVLLETIAGFLKMQSGRIFIDGQEVTLQPPEARQIGFMFQDYALFPNRTVKQNILFPLRFRKKSLVKKNNFDVREIMNMLRIDHLADRSISGLSGGEKQRVALARALMTNPRIFMFDEPMSALDTRAKEELRIELRQLFRELSLTVIYVTHDQAEAAVLSDVIFIMKDGSLAQIGSREEVFYHPSSQFTAEFVGMENLFPSEVVNIQTQPNGQFRVNVKITKPDMGQVLTAYTDLKVCIGERVFCGIRPENVEVSHPTRDELTDGATTNVVLATVSNILPWGVVSRVYLQGLVPVIAYLNQCQLRKIGLAEGKHVQVAFPVNLTHIIRS